MACIFEIEFIVNLLIIDSGLRRPAFFATRTRNVTAHCEALLLRAHKTHEEIETHLKYIP